METVGEEGIIEALKQSRGNVSHAARLLGVNRRTVHRCLVRHPHLREIVDDLHERIIDKAEENLFDAVERGDLRASWRVLTTLGKDRGYTQRREVEPPGPRTLDQLPTRELLVLLEKARERGENVEEGLSEEDVALLRRIEADHCRRPGGAAANSGGTPPGPSD